jgi:hypothetical protein
MMPGGRRRCFYARPMVRLRTTLLAAAAVLLVAACGGSSSSSSASHTTPATTSSSSAATTSTTSTSSTAVTTTSTTSPPPEVPAAKSHPKRSKISTADSDASVPAAFAIVGAGKLSPASIAVPAQVAVDLAVANHTGDRHTLTLEGPTRHTLQVPAGGHAAATVSGLPNGTYRVLIDGASQGQISVGTQGGP